jgi:hypothetical protein
MHFKLDGQLIWFPNAKDLLKRANQSPDQSGKRLATNVHVDVAFGLDNGILAFADRRRSPASTPTMPPRNRPRANSSASTPSHPNSLPRI